MFRAEVVETFTDAPLNLVSGIGDMMLATIGGRVLLYTSTRAGGGLMVLEAGPTLALLAQSTIRTGGQLSAPPSLDLYEIGGRQHLIFSGGAETSLVALRLSADGTPAATVRPPGGPQGVITAQALITMGGQRLLYAAMAGDGAVQGWQVAADGVMTRLAALPPGTGQQGVNISAMSAFSLGASQYLATASLTADRIALFRIGADGGLTETASVGAAEGLGISDPSALRVVTAHGQTWVLAASAGSSSLTLLSVSPAGALSVADHVIDTLDTRLQGVRAVETVTIGNRAFVVAGGGDGGLHVFEILPGGRLLLSATVLHQPGLALDNITSLLIQPVADGFEIFVAGEGAGITRLRVATGTLAAAITGGAGADILSGTAAHDLILGGAGNDTLYGGAGNDILMDGPGQDRLWGGAGADVFVLSSDGETDYIMDYQPGVDVLDLTAWGRLYGPGSLSITPTANGAVIRYDTEELVLFSANGLPIPVTAFGPGAFLWLWHAGQGIEASGVRFGTEAADHLVGAGSDDIFRASPGRDVMIGGDGFDLVDYIDAPAAVRVDLLWPATNAGLAALHQLIGIEGLSGSVWNDTLGGDHGSNLLLGGDGHDALDGRGGNDSLFGGDGDDTLVGGPGADLLDGGAGFDTVSYWNALTAVRVSLLAGRGALGDAAGDVLVAIEAVQGSAWNDTLSGDAGANRLWGLDGDDVLEGEAGNDTLFGGNGNDTLVGGAGADVLYGGPGRDMASYWTASEGVRADLIYQSTGTGDAEGDTYFEIEDLGGTAFADILAGNGLDNMLLGGPGDDLLVGRHGDDTLYGGVGNDVLIGGPGADLLDGGPGDRDFASYRDALSGLRADLIYITSNTGDAAGDRYVGIEGLEGSIHGDTLAGDHGANILSGLAGDDVLAGRGGNDTIYGGAGNDTIYGGAGHDVLFGGAGADVFVFEGGYDIIMDFTPGVDRLLLPRDLVPGPGGVRPEQITVLPDGIGLRIWLDGGGLIDLRGLSHPDQLVSGLILV
ncbi:calcium-binding protein [Pseudogemmobacter humi]|uniref:Bifunctional hemolysin/adenylate cyclase n=1 Tax=Pseudogemmobacter humi TaxID=2483812 RepID=A0A3P5XVG8_9RHOB|nr:calcium-binding protein [Pseudogemmobacter humi]VDC33185.1 Bifunctional hemolysin/adenylate cyclase precursor [Pseudogemmobacter humi]